MGKRERKVLRRDECENMIKGKRKRKKGREQKKR